ncbi:MAG: T9SS type A sorting domain-containing protein [Candidatus Delongbacteria bacterium]|nr:T9SS type A sorting domain-containing protein [Candidatus Delongbacteria bacterium]
MKKFNIALIFIILMVQSVLFSQFPWGTGTEEDPYHVTTPEELNSVRDFMTSYFTLDCDVDLALYLTEGNGGYNNGEFWEPIGTTENPFKGTIYGNMQKIKNLKINRPDSTNVGFIGYAEGTTIKDVKVEVDIVGKVNGKDQVGSLIGNGLNSSIFNCSTISSIEGEGNLGGLIGYCDSCIVSNCSAASYVKGLSGVGGLIGATYRSEILMCQSDGVVEGKYEFAGGLIGICSGTLKLSFSTSTVIGGELFAGGLTGGNWPCDLMDCFALGNVSGDQYIGGLTGSSNGNILNCYSVGNVTGTTDFGGLLGTNSGLVTECYWNTEISGQETSAGGEGKTTAEMMLQSTYTGWDFTSPVWKISTQNFGYPHLAWDHRFDFAGGSGTAVDPYLISEPLHLDNVRNFLDANFKQTADLDLQWYENWSPIGYIASMSNYRSFSGTYNGNGFTIDNLFIYEPEKNNIGLFGYTCYATISNMNIKNSNVTGGNNNTGTLGGYVGGTEISDCNAFDCSVNGVSGVGGLVGALVGESKMINCNIIGSSINGTGYYTGGIAGLIENYSEVIHCFSNNQVNGALYYTGGLVGFSYTFSSILDSYSSSEVNGNEMTGGLVGCVTASSIIRNSYAKGYVNGSGSDTGGFVGNASDWPIIQNCYSKANVIGNENVGGFAGLDEGSEVTNCYSTGTVSGIEGTTGGFVGEHIRGTINSSYWDMETSGQTASAGGEGRTTEEMTYPFAANTYIGWDFTTIWGTLYLSYGDYPYLEMEGLIGIEENNNVPEVTELYQNYPNPFNPVTEIRFDLNTNTDVILTVYNSNGQLVKELVNEKLLAGYHKARFDASGLNSGLYFYRLNYCDKAMTKKMILVK